MAKSTASATGKVPIRTLYSFENDPRVIQRIVGRNSEIGEGEIETVLLKEAETYHVIVRSMLNNNVRFVVQLQDNPRTLGTDNRICWATFDESGFPVPCALSSPTQIRLWDTGSGTLACEEGSTLHLPCEATAIFPLQKGLIVQRRLVAEDQEQDDDMLCYSSSRTETDTPPRAVSSLFSILHPLHPILPVANSNILEHVHFIGQVDGIQICVTFHAELKRHAVFLLEETPPVPKQTDSSAWKLDTSTTFVVEQDLLQQEGEESFYAGAVSRNEALADALGVSNRPMSGTAVTLQTPPAAGIHLGASQLHPDFNMTLLYEAMPKNPPSAHDIFIADNFLCLSSGTELRIWKIENRQVTPIATLPCLAAIPVTAFPASPVSKPITDLLVVNNNIQLFRGGNFIADCAVVSHEVKDSPVAALSDAVGKCFTITLQDGSQRRGELNLELSPMVESILGALRVTVGVELACHLRLDCVRYVDQFVSNLTDDPSSAALSFCLREILGLLATKPTSPPPPQQSSWDALCSSSFHADMVGGETSCLGHTVVLSSTCVLQSVLFMAKQSNKLAIQSRIFDSMHLLYEEFKLSTCSTDCCTWLGSFLAGITGDSMLDFRNYYQCASPPGASRERDNSASLSERTTSFAEPPSILMWIEKCLRGTLTEEAWIYSEATNSFCPRIVLVRDCFSTIVVEDEDEEGCASREIEIVRRLVEASVVDAMPVLQDLPVGVRFPLMDILARYRQNPRLDDIFGFPKESWNFIGRNDLYKQVGTPPVSSPMYVSNGSDLASDRDGLVALESSHALRFPLDNRLKEAGRLLRSSKPVFLKVQRAVEVSDHDYERLKQERLVTLISRVLALPLGRGMLTLGTFKPAPAEQLPMPELCLSGRVPPTNISLACDTSNTHPEMIVWPSFHNGVAAGLRLPRSGHPTFKISRSWIVYNRTAGVSEESSEATGQAVHAHGGLLMALGLRGHLSELSTTDTYQYLTQGSVTTSVGVLLGMAANKRGTCDPSVSKMLCLHIPSLLPASFSSIDVSGPVHAAAVTGIGLLYQGSSHRLMTEFLLNEMGRRPLHDSSTVDREAYTLSCGLSLGMMNLGKGGSNSNAGLADLEIEQRLLRFVTGGVDDRSQRRQQDNNDRRLNANGGNAGESERCSRVYEGASINNDVTASGALVALGLLYLKTRNKAVASSLVLPDTHFLLEYARPDTLMLRVLARSLILWDDVEPRSCWIEEQIPPVVRRAYKKMKALAKKQTSSYALGTSVPQNDSTDTIAQDETPEATERGKTRGEQGNSEQDSGLDQGIDWQTIRQIRAYVSAGACFSIGLRFAGTSNDQAASAITAVLKEMKSFRDGDNAMFTALRPDLPVVETCLAVCAISLALVMTGTGDLATLRVLKTLRCRSDAGVRHGTHMTVGAAIGLLFLGGGMCSIGRSAEDIAALVAAFFPRFAMTTTDNKFHLQALRHLYVLAVKERHVRAIDVDSDEEICVTLEAHFKDTSITPLMVSTPGLVLNSESRIAKLVVSSNKYFHSEIYVPKLHRGGFSLFVKRHAGSSPEQDSQECQGLESDSICQCQDEVMKSFCVDRKYGCVSSPLSRPISLIQGLLGSSGSNSDVVLIKCYYERMVLRRQWRETILSKDDTALLIEKFSGMQYGVGSRQSRDMVAMDTS